MYACKFIDSLECNTRNNMESISETFHSVTFYLFLLFIEPLNHVNLSEKIIPE